VKDFDYYIGVAAEAEKRSYMLWQLANRFIRVTLERFKKQGKTLAEAAAFLDKAAGPEKKNEPVSLCNFRAMARALRSGEELVLL
jgi:hypothetical protein